MDVKDAVDLYRAVLRTYSEEFDLRDVLGRIAHVLGGRKPLLFLREPGGFRIRLWAADWDLAEVSRLASSAVLDETHPDFPRKFRMADAALAESLGLPGLVNGTGERLMIMPVPLHGEPRALLALLVPGAVPAPHPHSFRLTAVASVIDRAVDLLEQRRPVEAGKGGNGKPEHLKPDLPEATLDVELQAMKRGVTSLEGPTQEHKDHRRVAAFSLDILIRLLDMDGGTVYLLPRGQAGVAPQLLAARGWTGLPGLLEVLFENDLVGWLGRMRAASTGPIFLDVNGLSEEFRAVEPYLYANNVNSFILSPLFRGDELEGVLALFGRAYNVFESEDLDILEKLSTRLAGFLAVLTAPVDGGDPDDPPAAGEAGEAAVDETPPADIPEGSPPENNETLRAQLKAYRTALAHLAELSAELSLISKPEAIKRLIAKKAMEITGAARATLMLYADNSIEAFTEGARDLPERLNPFLLAPLVNRALAERRTIRSTGPAGDGTVSGLPPGESIVVPILAGGDILGAIVLERPESGSFGPEGAGLAEAVAGCCMAALQVLRQQERSAGSALALPLSERISGMLRGSMTFEEICEVVHVELKADLDADLSAICVEGLSGTRTNALLRGEYLEAGMFAPLYDAYISDLQPDSATGTEPVLRHISAGAALAEEAPLVACGIRSYVLLPVSTNETRGFWVVGAATSYAFDEYETDILRRVAGMLSAILEAALYRENIEHAHTQLQDEFFSLEEQNQFKTDLLNMASHEVRHPLTLLMGFSEVLNDYYPSLDSSEMLRVVRKIGKSAERLKRRVANLLELSRIESGRMELEMTDVELEPLLREMGEELELENPGHHIYLNFPSDFPRVRADREKMEIVLFNLIENSIKYSPSGGDIHVKGIWDGATADIQITDEGIGIDAEDLEAIFKPFRRGTEKVKTIGMGLGLYIVDTIVRAHGGSIEVASRPGYGSTFTIKLDLSG